MPPEDPSNVLSTWHVPFSYQREPSNSGERVCIMCLLCAQRKAEEKEEAPLQRVSTWGRRHAGTQGSRRWERQGQNWLRIDL